MSDGSKKHKCQLAFELKNLCVYEKHSKQVTILFVVLSYREGEELFQFLFLETEIKNSWEAYFEDAKQKLGKGLLQRILMTILFLCLLKFAFYL